ncbi:MAG TPA: hypothetical protein VGL05_19505 [Kribbella sp.]
MSVPTDNATAARRLKALEQEIAQLRGYLATTGLDVTITTPANTLTVTSPTWTEAFTLAGPRQATDWLVQFRATCASGTTGQVRAVISGTATELMPPVDVLDGATLDAAWTLDPPGDFDDQTLVEIQAQRTTGTGTFTVRPYSIAGA